MFGVVYSNFVGSESGQIQSAKLLAEYGLQQNPVPHREGWGGGGELNQREGERCNRGEYRSQSWVENTNMTECTQEIGYLQPRRSMF
jgi:hypothetical protein